jgi:hypothetical protein
MGFPGGTPIAPYRGIGAGVLGGWCNTLMGNVVTEVFITNSHVLAPTKEGMKVVITSQPTKPFAGVHSWGVAGQSLYDVAVCIPYTADAIDENIIDLGAAIWRVADPVKNEDVRMYSTKKNRVLRGTIAGVGMQTGHHASPDDFIILFPDDDWPEHGDSGSLIARDDGDGTPTILGLYWGKTPKFKPSNAAHPIKGVFKQYGLFGL